MNLFLHKLKRKQAKRKGKATLLLSKMTTNKYGRSNRVGKPSTDSKTGGKNFNESGYLQASGISQKLFIKYKDTNNNLSAEKPGGYQSKYH